MKGKYTKPWAYNRQTWPNPGGQEGAQALQERKICKALRRNKQDGFEETSEV